MWVSSSSTAWNHHSSRPSSYSSPTLFLSYPTEETSFSSSSESTTKTTKGGKKLSFQLHASIAEIPPQDWDDCLTTSSSPFLQHSWLHSLEQTECVSPNKGWVPQHISLTIKRGRGGGGGAPREGRNTETTDSAAGGGGGGVDTDNNDNNEDEDGVIIGYVPLYIKAHSMGEFIFDNSWAEAAFQSGINYYPKLLVGVPFTPVTGERILLRNRHSYTEERFQQIYTAVSTFLKQLAESNRISSVHINFMTEREAKAMAGPLPNRTKPSYDTSSAAATATASSFPSQVQGLLRKLQYVDTKNFLRRTSLQYHWTNCNRRHEHDNQQRRYIDFEDYLACFKSKRRITIKRERQKVLEEEGITVTPIGGQQILEHPGLVDKMYELYASTVDKVLWGRQYLSREFFHRLVQTDFLENLVFLCARRRGMTRRKQQQQQRGDNHHDTDNDDDDTFRVDDIIAGTVNIVKDGVFYGRYWGCLEDVKNLHFETCYWSAIEYCIRAGLDRMEPGAGGGDYKWARGFDPTLIHSVHYIRDGRLRRAVSQFCDTETEQNLQTTDDLLERSSLGAGGGE